MKSQDNADLSDNFYKMLLLQRFDKDDFRKNTLQ